MGLADLNLWHFDTMWTTGFPVWVFGCVGKGVGVRRGRGKKREGRSCEGEI